MLKEISQPVFAAILDEMLLFEHPQLPEHVERSFIPRWRGMRFLEEFFYAPRKKTCPTGCQKIRQIALNTFESQPKAQAIALLAKFAGLSILSCPESPHMTTALKIDFVSDVSCPRCVIGLRALDQAIARIGSYITADIHFQPFELNPKMAAEGQEITEHITEKYGIPPAQVNANRENIRARGADVGFKFAMATPAPQITPPRKITKPIM